ncbi:MAG TPA: NADH-quinone oxidoreductase subunit C [Rectinemataceae bacterium]|nr:NADH-quinone oxidoreductase subunit C [Rectinemataceae bacterium]
MRDIAILAAAVPGAEIKDGMLLVPASGVVEALGALKKLGGLMLFDISAVDRPASATPAAAPAVAASPGAAPAAPVQPTAPAAPCFELSYRLMDMQANSKEFLTVRVILDHEAPALPSIAGFWPAADVLEREVWDLMGIEFTGRPKLERILLKGDFVGHPLRKDFVPPKRERFRSPAWDNKLAEGGL